MLQNDAATQRNDQSHSVASSSEHLKNTNFDRTCTNGNGLHRDDNEKSTDSEDKKPAAQPRTTRARNGITKPRSGVSSTAFCSIVRRPSPGGLQNRTDGTFLKRTLIWTSHPNVFNC